MKTILINFSVSTEIYDSVTTPFTAYPVLNPASQFQDGLVSFKAGTRLQIELYKSSHVDLSNF